MPEFCLNTDGAPRAYDELDEFAKGYIEAMFFTNADSGDDDEHKANRLGVKALTRNSIRSIAEVCAKFQSKAHVLLSAAYGRGYTAEQAGRDLWFSRQGHGVGYWDRKELKAEGLGDKLHEAAKRMGEANCFIYSGRVYHP